MLNAILIVVQLLVCVLLIVLVLLHSGKDAGMSSVTGFSFAAQASVMERNLTRYTDHRRRSFCSSTRSFSSGVCKAPHAAAFPGSLGGSEGTW